MQELVYDKERLSERSQLLLHKITHMDDKSIDSRIEELSRTEETPPIEKNERVEKKACCTIL